MPSPKKPADAQATQQAKERSPTEVEESQPVAGEQPPASPEDEVPASASGGVPITSPLNHEQLQRLRRKLKIKFHQPTARRH